MVKSLFIVLLFWGHLVSAEMLRFSSIDYCPFTCNPQKEAGKEGIMTEVVRATFEELGYEIQVEIMPYVRAVRTVSEGKHDGILVVGKNYAPQLIYPNKPTLTQRMMFIIKPTTTWRYTDYTSLLTVPIAIQAVKGFDYADDSINAYVLANPDTLIRLSGATPITRGLELLNLGRVSTYFEGELTALYNINKQGYANKFRVAGFSERIFEDYTGFNPHSPNSAKYAQLLSDKIAQLQQSGELDMILSKYGLGSDVALGQLIE